MYFSPRMQLDQVSHNRNVPFWVLWWQQEFVSAELGQGLVVIQMFRFQETLFSLELGYFPSVKL